MELLTGNNWQVFQTAMFDYQRVANIRCLIIIFSWGTSIFVIFVYTYVYIYIHI